MASKDHRPKVSGSLDPSSNRGNEPCSQNSTGRQLRELRCFPFAPCELVLLNLFRHVILDAGTEASETRPSFLVRAEGQFGVAAAPLLLSAIIDLVNALQRERQDPFQFVSPNCESCRQSICEDEFLVMCAIVSARCDDGRQMHLAVCQVTKSAFPVRLVQAVRAVAQLLNLYFGHPSESGRSPGAVVRLH